MKKNQLKDYLEGRKAGFSDQDARDYANIDPGVILRKPVFPSPQEVKEEIDENKLPQSGYDAIKKLRLPFPKYVCQIVKESIHYDHWNFMFIAVVYEEKVSEIEELLS